MIDSNSWAKYEADVFSSYLAGVYLEGEGIETEASRNLFMAVVVAVVAITIEASRFKTQSFV